ncbi:sigma-54-dependent transcriptional regulator [Xanthobacter sp. TB0139]|uniref:sigma-54-dependent transcriptional regulator n=1 Tax=Xanthobacter sp. TB0139 TaxID=3459178 RepID=UPI0040394A94
MDIFILEEDAHQADLLAALLVKAGRPVRVMPDAQKALHTLASAPPALVFLGQPHGAEGQEALLAHILAVQPRAPVVALCIHPQMARRFMRQGAYDVMCRPFNTAHLQLMVERAEEALHLRRDVEHLQRFAPHAPQLVGQSSAMQALRVQMRRASAHGEPLLLHGPEGAGRELVARLVHAASYRQPGPFITCRLAQLDGEQQEKALFGRDAAQGRKLSGALDRAQGGTLFLDDIAELSPHLETRVLEVLKSGAFPCSGSGRAEAAPLRLMASSAKEKAKESLLFRGLPPHLLRLPALDERREDIPDLVAGFMKSLTRSSGLPACHIMPGTIEALQARAWPGDVRQLRNMVEQMLISAAAAGESIIRADMLSPEPAAGSARPDGQLLMLSLREARERFEREYLIAQLRRSNGNLAQMARAIQMEGSALRRKMQRLSIDWRKR